MDTHSPFEGDAPDDDEPTYEWLDEWLCEYVDGTMDPSLEAVFEKYVEANPELKAHVERLKETRELLCNCGLSAEPSEEMEAAIRRDVDGDEPPPLPSEAETAQNQPLAALGFVSSVAVALVVGFLVGAMVVSPVPSGSSSAPSAADRSPTETERPPPSLQRTQTTADWEDPRVPLSLAPADSGRPASSIPTSGGR
jgi:hypothetical protein